MKFSWKWLKDYCPTDADVRDIAERLGLYGFEVETVSGDGDAAVLDIEIVPVRPDCLSHIGLARELAFLTGTPLTLPQVTVREVNTAKPLPVEVTVTAPDLCPRYSARVVTGVRVAPSPAWLAERLQAAGVRALNNVVDITNFVNLERGQPLHAFDLVKLRGGKLIIRRAAEGEKLTLINGRTITLTADDLVIADAVGPVALAGIMGGAESEVSASTESVVIESAFFDATSIRRTARRYELTTESSYRFERGVDPAGTLVAADRAAALMAELAQGTVLAPAIDVGQPPPPPKPITLRPARANILLGTRLSGEQMADLLRQIYFDVDIDRKENLVVTPPSFRKDVVSEVDVIEEIARIHGYHNIPAVMPGGRPPEPKRVPREHMERTIKEFFVAAGFTEVVTPSFTNPAQLAAWGIETATVALTNAVSPQFSHLRPALWPAVAEVASRNGLLANATGATLFEIGAVFAPGNDGEIVERNRLAAVVAGEVTPRHWSRTAATADFFFLKGVWEEFARRLGTQADWRGDRFTIADAEGFILEFDLPPFGKGFASELDLGALYTKPVTAARYVPISRFPSITRDLALVVDETVAAGDILAAVAQATDLAREVTVFDLFYGEGIPAGKKGLGIRIRYQADDHTLTDEEANAARENTLKILADRFGAQLRR